MIRYSRFASEIMFVIAILLVMKYKILPYLFVQWADEGELWQLLVWNQIVFGVLSCLVYLGFGSISRQVYTLSKRESIGCFLLLHIPLFLSFSLASDWKQLFADAWALFLPSGSLNIKLVFLFYLLLFVSGRQLQISEQANERSRLKRIQAKMCDKKSNL